MSGVKTWYGVNDIPEDFAQCVTAIGVFDGIHRGHQQLITAAVQRARELDVPAVLMTFAPHPLAVVAPNRVPPLLCDVDERARRAQELGVDYFLAVEFSRDLAALSPQDFIDTIVVGRLHARAVFVGENFTFGHKASGTTETLRELGESRGFEAHVVDLLTEEDEDGTALSSSYAHAHCWRKATCNELPTFWGETILCAASSNMGQVVEAVNSATPQRTCIFRTLSPCQQTGSTVVGSAYSTRRRVKQLSAAPWSQRWPIPQQSPSVPTQHLATTAAASSPSCSTKTPTSMDAGAK